LRPGWIAGATDSGSLTLEERAKGIFTTKNTKGHEGASRKGLFTTEGTEDTEKGKRLVHHEEDPRDRIYLKKITTATQRFSGPAG
jgi:hypothetical protein